MAVTPMGTRPLAGLLHVQAHAVFTTVGTSLEVSSDGDYVTARLLGLGMAAALLAVALVAFLVPLVLFVRLRAPDASCVVQLHELVGEARVRVVSFEILLGEVQLSLHDGATGLLLLSDGLGVLVQKGHGTLCVHLRDVGNVVSPDSFPLGVHGEVIVFDDETLCGFEADRLDGGQQLPGDGWSEPLVPNV